MSYNLRVESYDFWGHQGHSCAKRAKHLGTHEAGVPSVDIWEIRMSKNVLWTKNLELKTLEEEFRKWSEANET